MKIFSFSRPILLLILVLGLLILGAAPGYAADGGVTYTPGPNMNVARMAHVTAALPGGKVAVFGGHGIGFIPLSSAEIWDPATNAFTRYNMNYTHDGGAIAKLADGRYLLAGGLSGGSGTGYSPYAEIFDPSGPTFTATGPMTQARALCAAATLTSGKVLVTGGWYNAAAGTYGDLFDPATGTFTQTGPLNTPRASNLVLPTSDGKAVVCGGYGVYNGYAFNGRVELYDPDTNTFSILQESLLPEEPGWFTFGLPDWTNGRSIETQRLSDGRYLLTAYNGAYTSETCSFILVTFDPATKTFARYTSTAPLPSSGLAMVYFPAVDLTQGKAYNLTRVGSWTAPFPTRNYTLDLASGSLYSPTGTTPLNDCMYAMGMNLLADGRLFLTGGGSAVSNFTALNKTFFATPNQGSSLPVAKAGSDQTVHAGDPVNLDGSGSYDPGGNVPLTYAWRFTDWPGKGDTPPLPPPTLSYPTPSSPTFVADKYDAGNWVLELVVTNSKGVQSMPASVTISTSNSAPVADAGADQTISAIGATVTLNGGSSYDHDGDPIAYQWVFTAFPGDSPPALSGADTATPSFVASLRGTYELSLTVKDLWVASAPATTKASFANIQPVANAGSNQSVLFGTKVFLNGSASSDADGDPLTYKWVMLLKPAGSFAEIINDTSPSPSFNPDALGDYVAQLIVNDGLGDSLPSTVTITVTVSRSWLSNLIRRVIDDIGDTGLLPDSAFKNKNMRNTMITKLNVILKDVEAGNYAGALSKLQNDVIAKTNGCAESLPVVPKANAAAVISPQTPDNNDWIIDCTYQSLIYPELKEIEACLIELAK
jgi:hypothetical protein